MTAERIVFENKKAWLLGRKDKIGGSDASSILGLNPYKSNTELWEEKTGLRESEDISDKPYVKYGTEAEEYLRELFKLDFPDYQVEYYDNNMWLNDEFPFAHASLDGELTDKNGRKGILEIKTSNVMRSNDWSKWNNRLPDNYYIQILHYLMVTGFEFAVLKAQLKSVYNSEIKLTTKHYFIERLDVEDDIEMLKEKEMKFYESIKKNIRPNLILPEI